LNSAVFKVLPVTPLGHEVDSPQFALPAPSYSHANRTNPEVVNSSIALTATLLARAACAGSASDPGRFSKVTAGSFSLWHDPLLIVPIKN
jgi:hypothetical protein